MNTSLAGRDHDELIGILKPYEENERVDLLKEGKRSRKYIAATSIQTEKQRDALWSGPSSTHRFLKFRHSNNLQSIF
jgi:hypothetical protein